MCHEVTSPKVLHAADRRALTDGLRAQWYDALDQPINQHSARFTTYSENARDSVDKIWIKHSLSLRNIQLGLIETPLAERVVRSILLS